MNRYRIFKRRWWRPNAAYPGGREPYPGRKLTLRYTPTLDAARAYCEAWNQNRTPYQERWGIKAEFEGV